MKRMLALGFLAAALLGMTPAPWLTAEDKKEDEKDKKGWVQLFNGKDLEGWEVHPKGTGPWHVEDGILKSSGSKNSHLFTKRDDYENFHYRIEAKISDKGNSGQYFRAQFKGGYPPGYEAQINSTHGDRIKTGSLYPSFGGLSDEDKKKILVTKMLVKPDEWFTQEVIAKGNHIIIKVNGKTTVDFVDKNNTYSKGRFALQQHDATNDVDTIVQFRKIEVKELPAEEKASIKGRANLYGQPLVAGNVAFHSRQGKFVVRLAADGSYFAENVPVGELKISVSSKLVPKKFAKPETSGLTVTLQKGENTFDIDLN
jgi:hypothetical protein